jgi:hypothetical protein
MRNLLLASTAAMALMLAGQAIAQSEHGKKPEQDVQQQQMQQPSPAHRPAAGQHRGTTGQASENENQTKKNNAGMPAEPQGGNKAEKASSDKSSGQEQNNSAASETKPGAPAKANAQNEQKPNEAAKSNAAKGKPAEQKSNAASEQRQNKAAQAPNGGSKRENAAAPNTTNDNNKANAASGNANGRNAGNTNVNIIQDQKVKISERIRHEHLAAPARNLNISVTVGERVPRRIHLHPLPRTIVTIAPEYRGYDYFTTEEDIVIVSPRTHEIVSRIPREASRARAENGGGTTVTSASGSGGNGLPCQVFRRTASGTLNRLQPDRVRSETTGSGSNGGRLAATVMAPNGQQMPELSLRSQTGRIVVETDGSGCRIIMEPGRAGR